MFRVRNRARQTIILVYTPWMSRTLPISHVKAHLPELVSGVADRGEEIIVTRMGHPAAVLINFTEYERVRETLAIMADHKLARAVRSGRAYFEKGGQGIASEIVFSTRGKAKLRAR
jgi:antitoxin YefM